MKRRVLLIAALVAIATILAPLPLSAQRNRKSHKAAPQPEKPLTEEQQRLLTIRNIGNLRSFCCDPKFFPSDGTDGYKAQFINFRPRESSNGSSYQNYFIDNRVGEIMLGHSLGSDVDMIGEVKYRDNYRVKILTKYYFTKELPDDWMNLIAARFLIYSLFDTDNEFYKQAYKSHSWIDYKIDLPYQSFLFSWMFMICRYKFFEELVYGDNQVVTINLKSDDIFQRYCQLYSPQKDSVYVDNLDTHLEILNHKILSLKKDGKRNQKSYYLSPVEFSADLLRTVVEPGLADDAETDEQALIDSLYVASPWYFMMSIAYRIDLQISVPFADQSREPLTLAIPHEQAYEYASSHPSPNAFRLDFGH